MDTGQDHRMTRHMYETGGMANVLDACCGQISSTHNSSISTVSLEQADLLSGAHFFSSQSRNTMSKVAYIF